MYVRIPRLSRGSMARRPHLSTYSRERIKRMSDDGKSTREIVEPLFRLFRRISVCARTALKGRRLLGWT